MKNLTKLAGVGRKTANVLLSSFYNIPAIVVDTHVLRISQKLKITKNKNPNKVEQDLQKAIPKIIGVNFLFN